MSLVSLVLLFDFVRGQYEHAKIFGNTEFMGYYYVDIWVGTPPKKQTVIIDTGSRLTAFPCIGCKECGTHLDKYFDYTNSSTSRLIACDEGKFCSKCSEGQCEYSQYYTEGSSISGILVEDYILFGDDFETAHRIKSTFGCHRRETHLFRSQLADGIMGIGKSDAIPTLIDNLYSDSYIGTDTFAICFGKTDGFMTIGGYNTSMHKDDIKWVKMHGQSYYSLRANGLYINYTNTYVIPSDFTNFYDTGTMLDSGTTFTYLSTKVHGMLFNKFKAFCDFNGTCDGDTTSVPGEPNTCYVYDKNKYKSLSDFFDTFPVISFLIDDLLVDWEPFYYFFAWPESPNFYCVGIYTNGGAGNVLGGNFMRGMDIVFDRTNGTVGFAKSDCDNKWVKSSEISYTETDNGVVDRKTYSFKFPWAFVIGFFILITIVICVLIYLKFKKRSHTILREQET
jgi:Eukaryotic aspartyl protease